MRSTKLPTVMLPYPSIIPLLAHRQMFGYCSLAKPDSQTKNKSLASQDKSYSLCRVTSMCLMAEIVAHSSVSSLWSLSVHLDPRSLLGLTTLVAPFLNSSEPGSYMHGTVACLWGPSSDRDNHHDTRQGRVLPTSTALAHI